MSRIGRMPIAIPAGVTVEVAENNLVTVKGPKGTLTRELPAEMEIKQENGEITIDRPNDLKRNKSLHGLTRSLLHNMVVGVSEGYTKKLEIQGAAQAVLVLLVDIQERVLHQILPTLDILLDAGQADGLNLPLHPGNDSR